MSVLYYLSLTLFFGLIIGKIVSLIKLPNVTGYLIAGLLIGPSISGLIPQNVVSDLGLISELALGIIAFDIGSQFSVRHLKNLGSQIMILTLIQALSAFFVVLATMTLLFKQSLPFSLVLSSITVATAPAATLLVIKQYNAKGPVVNTLLPVVAIDDAIGIMVFSIASAVAKAMMNPIAASSLGSAILAPIWEILLALVVGLLIGFLLSFIASKINRDDELLVLSLASILIGVAVASRFHLSSLIVCMVIGATITNLIAKSKKLFSLMEDFVPPIYIAFFTLSGAELNLSVLSQVGLIGFGYIIARSIGKIAGAFWGSKILHMPKMVQKYLGITLLPQAGVAIGLSIVAQSVLPEYANSIRTIVLSATIIYELVGPLLTKIALTGAGEISLESK